jgi:spore coat protein U-like protein
VTATVAGNITFTGTVYGRIPAGQNFSAGAYTDTITVTVTNYSQS